MQICKKNLLGIFLLSFSVSLFAESIEMPEMPELSEMPEISMPVFDGSFYKPSLPKLPKKENHEENEAQTETKSSESLLNPAKSTEDLITSFLTNSSTLTAQDISSLYDYGMFSDVSSLSSNTQNLSTNVMLNQILSSLDELKTEQKKATPAQQETLNDVQTDSQTFKTREPSILRFRINGYSVLESLSTVFFSEPESDGTFLLTADRKYFADNKPRTETFYILFKAVKTLGGAVSYEVQPSVVQDFTNENSFIYRLAAQKNLTAEKTGNLVVLRSEGDVRVDLLLNLDN